MPPPRVLKRTASVNAADIEPSSKKTRRVSLLPPSTSRVGNHVVMATGQGDVGQLGLGDDVIETKKFLVVKALGNKIVDIKAGGMHTLALDCDGKVWSFGCNDEGALGRLTPKSTEETCPAAVKLPHPVVMISAGDSHSAALLENGQIYAWGAFRDSHGTMGLIINGRENKSCIEPVQLQMAERVVSIASGSDHLVLLTASGVVYTMGCPEQGQLGRLSKRSSTRETRYRFHPLLVPTKVPLKTKLVRIWAGFYATFALDTKNTMYAWGLNNYGQLGITGVKYKSVVYIPILSDAFNNNTWEAVAPGQHHTLALDKMGKAYSIGRCEYGRLGLGEPLVDSATLQIIPKFTTKVCTSVAVSATNSFAVTNEGQALSWGMGSEGQLGIGNTKDVMEPTKVVLQSDASNSYQARLVSAGGQHAVLLVSEHPAEGSMLLNDTNAGKKRKRTLQRKVGESVSSSSQPKSKKTKKLNGNEEHDPGMPMDVETEPIEKSATEERTDDTEDIQEMESETQDTAVTSSRHSDAEDSDVKPEAGELSEVAEAPAAVLMATPEVTEVTEVNGTQEAEVEESKTVEALPAPTLSPSNA